MSNYALAFLANDRYLEWATTFLESVRSKDQKLPLYCIPHGGSMARILGLKKAFEFEILQEGLDRLDAFAKRLYPRHARYRANLRKYSALTLPVDEVAYFDVDVLMLTEPSRLFGHIQPAHVDFLYLSTSPHWVYAAKSMHVARSLFPDLRLMSAGAFVTSRFTLTLDDLITTIEDNLELFRSLRRSKVYDQPVLNFVLHRLGKSCRHISELDASLAGIASARNPNLQFTNDKLTDRTLPGDVVAIHWAGNARSWFLRANPQSWSMQRVRELVRQRALHRIRESESPRGRPA